MPNILIKLLKIYDFLTQKNISNHIYCICLMQLKIK